MQDMFFNIFFGEGFGAFISSDAAFDSGVQVCVDEDAVWFQVAQDVVGTAPDDDAAGFLGEFCDDIALCLVDGLNLMNIIIVGVHEGLADGDGVERMAATFSDLMYVFFGEGGMFGDFFEYLFIVIIDVERFCDAPSELPTSASKLTCDRNDGVHSILQTESAIARKD